MTSWQPNSRSTCRQAPQGRHGAAFGLKTATVLTVRSAAEAATMPAMAFRSAQMAKPYDAFSTLHPVNTMPAPVRTAAPTEKLLYGAYARSATSRALASSCSADGDAAFTARPIRAGGGRLGRPIRRTPD